jgi:hypothetical protein
MAAGRGSSVHKNPRLAENRNINSSSKDLRRMQLLPVKINQSTVPDSPNGVKLEYKRVTFGFALCIVIIHCDQ